MKCYEIQTQKIACKKPSLNADNEITRTLNKYKLNKPEQTTLKYERSVQNYKYSGGWLTAHCSYLNMGVHLHLVQFGV